MEEDKKGRKVRYSKKFLKAAARLPEKIILQAEQKEKVFRIDPFHPSLKTHKLSGREKETWAFWINDSYRIKFIFLPNL